MLAPLVFDFGEVFRQASRDRDFILERNSCGQHFASDLMKVTGLVIFVFWTLLFLADFPAPMGDDIYFCGAAINLVQGGSFSNPYCPSLAFLGARDHFYVYMPLQSFALTAWVALFGISRKALVAFQCLAAAGASLALLDFVGIPAGLARKVAYTLGVSFSVAIFASGLGLRPDLLGLVLFCLGLRLLKSHSGPVIFVTSCFLFLSVIASPNIGFLVPLVLVYVLFFSPAAPPIGSRPFVLRVVTIGAAGIFAVWLFLIMIDFQLGDFLRIFNKTRENATFYVPLSHYLADPWFRVRLVINTVGPMLLALALPVLPGLFPKYLAKPISWAKLLFFLAAAGCTCFVASSSGSGICLVGLFSLILTLFFTARLKAPYETAGLIFFCGLLLFCTLSQGRALIQWALLPLAPARTDVAAIRQRLEELKPDYVYVDSAAAAQLYNYKLPPRTYDCFFGVEGIWRKFPVASDLPKNSVLVVSSQTAFGFNYIAMTRDPGAYTFVPLPLINRVYSQLAADPYALVVIPVDGPGSRQ